MSNSNVRILHGALDMDGDRMVLRGTIDPQTFVNLQNGPYQREVLPKKSRLGLIKAFEDGCNVPDIDLGNRGGHFGSDGPDTFILDEPVFTIDGLQRVSSAVDVMDSTSVLPRLGATVWFETDEAWERERFLILNNRRSAVSPNVLARNMIHDSTAVRILHGLTVGVEGPSFPLRGRVCWEQRMKTGEHLTALTMMKTVGQLHGHVGPCRTHRLEELVQGLDTVVAQLGDTNFTDNVCTFFELIDGCWGLRNITYKDGACYLRSNFLFTMARLFCDHLDFWKTGERLVIDKPLAAKIGSFPVGERSIIDLASSSGQAGNQLYYLLRNHINKGRRARRLQERNLDGVQPDPTDDDDSEEGSE